MLLTVWVAISCFGAAAQLTKSQLKMTSSYFEMIANHPKYIRLLNQELAKLKLESDNLSGALQSSDSVRIISLINAIDEFEKSTLLPSTIDQELNAVNQYIQTYYAIIPNGFGVYQALKGTSETIGGVFGVGGLIGTLLPNREPSLSRKKKVKIQRHVLSAEPMILANLANINTFLSEWALPRIDRLNDQTSEDFQSLLESIEGDNSPMDYYTRHNRLVTRFQQKLLLTKSLAHLLIKSTNTFQLTEQELSARISEKRKIDLTDTHFSEMIVEVSKINATIQEIQSIEFK